MGCRDELAQEAPIESLEHSAGAEGGLDYQWRSAVAMAAVAAPMLQKMMCARLIKSAVSLMSGPSRLKCFIGSDAAMEISAERSGGLSMKEMLRTTFLQMFKFGPCATNQEKSPIRLRE